ncbi:hypothetical protein SBADM41S_02622 [Streptomyces badius]
MAFGSVGEFGPIIAMALLFSGRSPGAASAVLAVFAVVTAGAVFWALRPRPPWFARIVAVTLHSSGQFAVRFVMLLLAGMLGLAHVFGLDTLLGAFAAGMLTRLVLQGSVPERSDAILERVEAMGFGFLVPFFYIVTGIDFDLAALLDGGRPLVLLPAFLLLFLLVRGVPAYLLAPRDLSGRPSRAALGLFSSTCLPLVVAITAIGLDEKVIGAGEAAALVAAAMVSVLVFPLLAFRLLRGEEGGERGRGRSGACGGERGGVVTGSPVSAAVPARRPPGLAAVPAQWPPTSAAAPVRPPKAVAAAVTVPGPPPPSVRTAPGPSTCAAACAGVEPSRAPRIGLCPRCRPR